MCYIVCSEYNHVRTWNVTRFRGMISTQPGSMPLASFKVISIESMEPHLQYMAINDFGKLHLFNLFSVSEFVYLIHVICILMSL